MESRQESQYGLQYVTECLKEPLHDGDELSLPDFFNECLIRVRLLHALDIDMKSSCSTVLLDEDQQHLRIASIKQNTSDLKGKADYPSKSAPTRNPSYLLEEGIEMQMLNRKIAHCCRGSSC